MKTISIKVLLISAGVCAGLIFGGSAVGVPPAQANAKRLELERKIADLSLLHQQLEDRMQQAQGLRTGLAGQQSLLTSEIHVLMKSHNIKNFQQAKQHLRVRYNIELLGTILSYIGELDGKLIFYQAGRDRLAYLRQLAEDDLRMIAAVNDLKIDALTTQISLVVNRYLPEAHVIQIEPQQVKPVSGQNVWESVQSSNH
ncbi:MAG: hypothetical protein C4519_16145 [Desulfobacteraceae bacterium]|nr:MAG: hypothetical protein C4519_16145 [Desulfobacteraceae bacterium]